MTRLDIYKCNLECFCLFVADAVVLAVAVAELCAPALTDDGCLPRPVSRAAFSFCDPRVPAIVVVAGAGLFLAVCMLG